MEVTKRLAFLMVPALLSACSGGGSGGAGIAPASSLKVPDNAAARTQMVKMSFTVPADLGSRAIGLTGHSRSLQYTSPEVMGVVAVQLCSQIETNTATNNGTKKILAIVRPLGIFIEAPSLWKTLWNRCIFRGLTSA